MNNIKIKYYYFFRGSLKTHLHLYEGWVKIANEYGIPLELITFIKLKRWFEQKELISDFKKKDHLKIYFGGFVFIETIFIFIFFMWQILKNQKTIVLLKKRSYKHFISLKKIFKEKIKIIIELEGDNEAEIEYLKKHPYKLGFYDSYIKKSIRANKNLEKALLYFDKIIVLSPYHKQLLENKYEIDGLNKKIEVFSTGVDVENFYFSEDLREKTRKELNLGSKYTLIYAGNAFYSWQNVFRTIEIFKLIKDNVNNNALMILLIRAEDHYIVNEFLELLNLSDADYILSSVPSDMINKYFNAADLGIILRHNHLMNEVSSPGKIHEYIASGLPVLMTKGISNFDEKLKGNNFISIIDDMDDNEEVIEKIKEIMNISVHDRQKIHDWAYHNISTKSFGDKYSEMFVELV
ncbi:hypothetical protein ES705_09831 [subsurface metagenome]